MDQQQFTEAPFSEARAWLQQACRVAVLTGAGISAESGIPTFREAQTGHWARFRPEDLASPAAYRRDPEMVWAWYLGRLRDVLAAQPNAGHAALAQLEAQKGDGFFLATQNVDGLHERAGNTRLAELHGSLLWGCSETSQNDETSQQLYRLSAQQEGIPLGDNGERLRPNVVWFGEMLPAEALRRAEQAFGEADVALVVGTSSLVQPAASLPLLTVEAGGKLIEVNPQRTPLSTWADACLQGSAGEVLPLLVAPTAE